MLQRSKIEQLLETNQSVFSIEDLGSIWSENDYIKVKALARYYASKNKIFRVKNGLYSIIQKPDILEVAQHLNTPSYISYHTALSIHGINFQFYSDIHCMALRNREINVQGQKVIYHQIKSDVLFNPLGVINQNGYNIATPERAICDSLYLSPGIGFDNLSNIDTGELFKIAEIYNNKSLIKNLHKYFPN
jgi:predicted transcriptional regulator of viral defense system